MIFLGAAQLVKNSMKHTLYTTINNKPKVVTEIMNNGDKYADIVTAHMHKELRGTVKTKDFTVFFCVDGIYANTAVEVKHVEDPNNVENWFFIMSALQTSFYASLLKEVTYLDTPAFMLDKGYPEMIRDLKEWPIYNYLMIFGKNKFLVEPSQKVFAHYMIKAQEIARLLKYVYNKPYNSNDVNMVYNYAAKWDEIYNKKEYYLMKYFNVKKLR